MTLRTMMIAAVAQRVTILVISPIGCGNYGNPPGEIAGLISELIGGEFKEAFEGIIIAVKGVDGSTGPLREFASALDATSRLANGKFAKDELSRETFWLTEGMRK